MSEQPVEEVAGQQSLDEDAPEQETVTPDPTVSAPADSPVQPATNGTGETPDSSSTPADTPDPTPGDAKNAVEASSAPTADTAETVIESGSDTPELHAFRVTHEITAPGAVSPHTVHTSAPDLPEKAILWLAHHVKDLPALIEILESMV